MKSFSRICLTLVLAFASFGALGQGWSPSHTELNAVGGTTTGATGGWLTGTASAVMFHVTSASTSSATVTFEQSVDGARWYTSATITNPTVAGELWICPSTYKVRFNITAHASGTLTGVISQRNVAADPIGAGCKKLDTGANTFGALAVTSVTDSGLTSGRVPIAGSGGLLGDSSAFTLTGGTLTVPNLTDSGLTITRVPYASTAGLLIDSAAFAFTTSGGILDATALRASGLTSGRVPFAGTAGLLGDSSVFTFSAGTLSATTFAGAFNGGSVTSSALTATRVPFAGTAGLLGDASGYTYISGALAVPTSLATTRFLSTGTAPTTDAGSSTCGTSAPSIAGKDQAGIITVGSVSGTVCHVNFNVAFANPPACVANGSAATNLKVSASTSILTITGTLTAAETISYNCLGF